MQFKTKNTAITRKKASAPLRFLLDFLNYKPDSVLDFGCGRGFDVKCMKENGINAMGYDPNFGTVKPGNKEQFDIVICSYVLNVIPEFKDRQALVNQLWKHVKPGGLLLLSARTSAEIDNEAYLKQWEQYKDGYISSKSRKTFQRGFDTCSLKMLTYPIVSNQYSTITFDNKDNFVYVMARKNKSFSA